MAQFAGIDVGLEHTYSCVLDAESLEFHYASERMSLSDSLQWLRQFGQLQGCCVDGPPNPNTGALKASLPADTNHNTDRRLTEFQLGIGGCYSTKSVPPEWGATNYWMQSSFELAQLLSTEFGLSVDRGGNDGQVIETHPTYAFKALLGCRQSKVDGIQRLRADPQATLKPKHSVAGHQQRIELLTAVCDEVGLRIDERLLAKWNQRIDWVDAAVCAFVSYWHQSRHPQLIAPGDPAEGTIYLRIPDNPFVVTEHTERKRETVKQAAVRGLPSHQLDGEAVSANAIVLRLGQTDELSQVDTIDLILTSHESTEEFWFPCGSNAMPRLGENLELIDGKLFLAHGGDLRVDLTVGDCKESDDPQPYPGDSENPWPVKECRKWLRIDAVREVETYSFYVNQQNMWANGFGQGQTALLWALVGVK